MISRLRPNKFKVLSLTTIATPHRGSPSKRRYVLVRLADSETGSAVADYVFDQIGGP